MVDELTIRIAHSCESDPRTAVTELHDRLTGPESALVLFFCSSEYDRDSLARELAGRFGDVPVVGCTTAGEIGPAGCRNHSISGVSLPASWFTVAIGHLDDVRQVRTSDGMAFAQGLRRRLEETVVERDGRSAFALLLVDGLFGHEEQLAHSLQLGLGELPLVGGSAGDSMGFDRTFVYWGGRFRPDAAALVLVDTSLPFVEFKTQHFVPTAERLVVTDADPSERLVREINGLPAAQEYARVLGVEPGELSPAHFAASPVVVLIDGANYVRAIQRVTPDGGLKLYCAIERGVVLRVARGVDLVANLKDALSRVQARIGPPRLVLAFDCILRRLEMAGAGLDDAVNEVLRGCRAVGFNTYGEQFCGVHVNQTLTAVAIGSGAEPGHRAEAHDG